MLKILRIDPRRKIVEEVEHDNSLESMYKLLGHDCDEFQAIVLNHKRDMLYIDANARTTNNCSYSIALDFWRHKRYHSPLLGRGLVIGCDDDGESIKPSVTAEQVAHEIEWRKTK